MSRLPCLVYREISASAAELSRRQSMCARTAPLNLVSRAEPAPRLPHTWRSKHPDHPCWTVNVRLESRYRTQRINSRAAENMEGKEACNHESRTSHRSIVAKRNNHHIRQHLEVFLFVRRWLVRCHVLRMSNIRLRTTEKEEHSDTKHWRPSPLEMKNGPHPGMRWVQ